MEPGINPQAANEAARNYIEEDGFAVLPAIPGEKEAKVTGWPQLIIGLDAVDQYFPPGIDLNITRVNGTNSGGRGDIDLDSDSALKVAQHLIPEEAKRFGREGKIPGHIEVRFADTVPRTTKYMVPAQSKDEKERCLVELRSDGSQTMIPPSTYPEGDRCVWHDGEVLEGHAVTIRGYAQDIAIAAWLLENYPGSGARHSFWLGVTGMLFRGRHPVERVRAIVEAVVGCANDPDLRDRMKIVDTTLSKYLRGAKLGTKKQVTSAAGPLTATVLEDFLGAGLEDSGLRHVVVSQRPLREVSDEATDALVEANDPPEIFSRSGLLSRIAEDSEGRPVVQDLDSSRLRYRMTRTAEFIKITKQGPEHTYPPDAVVADVAAAKAFSFPELIGITQSPVLRPGGTVLDKPGYDAETRLVYIPEEKVEVNVPFEPTKKEVEAAVALLADELLGDFPFVDDASLANMLALTMTPILRPAYAGPTPLAVIDKPSMGTGASLLTEVVCQIATAQPAAMMSPPESDEETRKQITSVLRKGRSVIVVDNLPGTELKNASWARVLTSTTWEDRILGHSRVATLPNRAVWIATGNNVKIGGDLPRRCYYIRLDAKVERPWERSPEEFTHPDLLGWVADQRGELLGAVLTVARHWFASGKPQWNGIPPGSFEGWARTIGGMLQAAGVEGFLGNSKKMLSATVEGLSEWSGFLTTWREAFGDQPLTTKQVIEHLGTIEGEALKDALPAELAQLYFDGTSLITRKFGEAFAKKEDVRHGEEGLRIGRRGDYKKSVLWAVEADNPGGGPRPKKEKAKGKTKIKKEKATSGPAGPEESGGAEEGGPESQVSHQPVPQGKNLRLQLDATDELQTVTSEKNFLGRRAGDSPDSPKGANVVPISRKFTFVEAEEALQRCIEHIKQFDRLAVDLETTGRDWWNDRIRIISITTDAGRTFVLDVAKVDSAELYRVLEGRHLILHHAAFDVPFLKRAGCNPERFSCTMVLSQLRWAGRAGVFHKLEEVAKRHAPDYAVKEQEVDHEVWKKETLPEHALEYAAGDTRALLGIYDDELEVLRSEELPDVAELEDRFLAVVVEVSDAGIPVDPEKWSAVIDEAIQRKKVLSKQLDGMLPEGVEIPEKFTEANSDKPDVVKINWGSHDQKVWAVETMGLSVPTKWDYENKVHKKTLDKDHLHLIDHPVAEGLREYQAIANFPTTYARAIEERFFEGWMYADWKQLEARTGRMSCCNPPIHNIPRKTALREAIVAPDGYKLIALDFSQIEPRILAAISRDKELLGAFRKGLDIYKFIGNRVTGVPMNEISYDLRAVFKKVVLGMIYGMGVTGLVLSIHRDIDPDMPEETIEGYYRGFFDAFPEAKSWRENLEAEFDAGSTETRTLLGRRRMDVTNRRQRWNAPIQGSAVDAFKLAAATLLERRDEVGGFRIIALIHDEVILLVPEERAERVEEWAAEVMSEAAASVVNVKLPKSLHIGTDVDHGAGNTLQEAKDAA